MRDLAERHAIKKNWKLERVLGSGGSAAVFAIADGQVRSALKVYDPAFLNEENGPAERHRLRLQESLVGHRCNSLVQIESIEFDLDTCFMCMEYLPWIELSTCLTDVPRANIGPLVLQLVDAVRFLEKAGLVHRDIKPHNVMISPDFSKLKLIDLGVIREIAGADDRVDGTDHGHRRPFVATAHYSSPEYLFRLREPSSDLWRGLSFYQIGAVIHDLIVGHPLFADEIKTGNRYAVAMAVLSKTPFIPNDPEVSLTLRRLASYCLTKDLDLRLQLVNWEDFQPDEDDAEKALARRLEQRMGGRRGQVALIEEQRRDELARRNAVEAVLTSVENEIKAGVLGAMFPERVRLKQLPDQALFRLHLPESDGVVDISIHFSWTEMAFPQIAGIAVASKLKHKASDAVLDAAQVTVGRLDRDGADIGIAGQSLCKCFVERVTKALDMLDGGFVVVEDTAQILDGEFGGSNANELVERP